MIRHITFDEILPIWRDELWTNRTSAIEPVSAMMIDGSYDLHNFDYTPSFFAHKDKGVIVGVNSGHMCCDGSYRSRGLYVHPNYRKQGIGKNLLLATINQAKIERARYVWSYPRKESFSVYGNVGFFLASEWREDENGVNAFCIWEATGTLSKR